MNQQRLDEIRVRYEADRCLGSYDDRDKGSWMNAAAMDREWLLSEVERLTAELAAMESDRDVLREEVQQWRDGSIIVKLADAEAERDAWRVRAEAAVHDLANAALCENCIHADNDECSETCGDSDSVYRWEWRGPTENRGQLNE